MGDVTFAEMMALEPHGPDTFVGEGPSYPWGGLYGGQIVAQALRAAGLTVDPAFRPHSLHGYFIRRGDADAPIRFEVDRLRDGRSFCTRAVVVRQGQGAIFNLSASFHRPEDGPDVPVEVDPTVPGPDGLPGDTWSHVFERRMVDTWDYDARPGPVARGWFRITEDVPDDPLLRACALAYVSDDLPTDGVVTLHPDRVLLQQEGDWERTFMNASLDHSIFFHRDADPTDWQLHTCTGHGVIGTRGLAIGDVFTASGVHVATLTQEVLIRRVRT